MRDYLSCSITLGALLGSVLARFTPGQIQDRLQRHPVIPVFPDFKPLELADRAAVEAVVHAFPPDSDFSFVNLYVWNAQVSSLHGNLAVRLTDYVSGTPYLTFIGRHNLAESASQLLDLAKAQCGSALLRLLPENVAHSLEETGLSLTADDAATDYIFAVEHVAGMHEWTGHSFRRRIHQFVARYPDYTIRHAPLHAVDPNEFRALFALWAARKGYASPQASYEYPAFERFLCSGDLRIETIGLYVDARLVGFSSFELLPGGTATVHFSKADNAFHGGICNVLYWEEARLLQTLGVTHYNWGPDLGLLSLRQAKKKYKPCRFQRKFTVHAPWPAPGDHEGGCNDERLQISLA